MKIIKRKKAVLREEFLKAYSPGDPIDVPATAKEIGVSIPTLYKWKKEADNGAE